MAPTSSALGVTFGAVAGFWASSIVFVLLALALMAAGRGLFGLFNRRFNLRRQLVELDNPAVALVLSGYLMGLATALGGALIGPSVGFVASLVDLILYGILAIVLLHVSAWLNDRLILYRFDNVKEIIQDRNCGAGVVMAANHLAVGLVVFGAVSGEGSVLSALVFWGLGQAALVLVTRLYDALTPYDLHGEVEKDNVAVGVAFAGVLVATGNIVRYGIQGDLVAWGRDLAFFGAVLLFGVVMLPVTRWVGDKLILRGRSLTDELVNQEVPNLGAGILEASIYVAMSFLIGWAVS
ncbi:protein of unknown function [Desulfacinum hydrothermale DSM 13146]|uniref:DUF350 domain-containing protein n=1 Tax=Desulfacinum hydrothermale DSM 13146 TaxID=1121390 RepID=A0A1W1XR50_9BACT|nr:DUF350 domain-containing protein [Desulfacinum hydrothermale]SMC25978.1 protein of unknown function [Desulfacinum hydrothermale DSM 13146]